MSHPKSDPTPPALVPPYNWVGKGLGMHYYQFHVSDYLQDTAHLSFVEDIVYRRLLDLYYTSEKPIINDSEGVARRIRMPKHGHVVQQVLEEFFSFKNDTECWHHKRCEEGIQGYQEKREKNQRNGRLGGRPPKNPTETQTVSVSEPSRNLNQEPITNNHKPIEKSRAARGTRLPQDFGLSVQWIEFCNQQRPDLVPQEVFAGFRDYWIAQPGQKGVKTDWDATWRNWVRRQQAPSKTAQERNKAVLGGLTRGLVGGGRDVKLLD